MKAIKSILVPVDFSELAAKSYRYALRLSHDLSASVHLVYCLPSASGTLSHPDIFGNMTQELIEVAEKNLKVFQEKGILTTALRSLPTVTSYVSIFSLTEAIARQTREKNIDLVLIGTHGVQGAWDRFFGTHSGLLVKKLKKPVLVLPAEAEYRAFKSICFATDFRDRDLKKAAQLAKALYQFLPHLHFLHVQNPLDAPPAEGLGFFRRAFERPQEGTQATFVSVTNDDVTDGIFDYLTEYQHDLLVMMKTNKGWWDRTFVHSETSEAAGITTLPLLILGESHE